MSTARSTGTVTLEALVARLDEQARQVAQLEAANAALRHEVLTLREAQAAGGGPARPLGGQPASGRSSRRRVLRAAAAMAAATAGAGALLTPREAHAMPADNYGNFSSSTSTPAVFATGTKGAIGVAATSDTYIGVYATSGSGFAVSAFSSSSVAVQGLSDGGNAIVGGAQVGAAYGVWGLNSANNANGVGVVGQSTTGLGAPGPGTGVKGLSGTGYGVVGASSSSVDLYAHGTGRLQQDPQSFFGAPTSGTYARGEQLRDADGQLFLCVASGTPGTWVRVPGVASGANGGALTFLSTPIRLLDTRAGFPAATTPGAKIQPGAANTFHLQVISNPFGGVSVPPGATAMFGNCTVVNENGVGDLSVYPDGLVLPSTATLHYTPGQVVSNAIQVGLSAAGRLAITALSAATDVIIDCQGFIA